MPGPPRRSVTDVRLAENPPAVVAGERVLSACAVAIVVTAGPRPRDYAGRSVAGSGASGEERAAGDSDGGNDQGGNAHHDTLLKRAPRVPTPRWLQASASWSERMTIAAEVAPGS